MVACVLAKDSVRVRFSLPAPEQRRSYIRQYESSGYPAENPWDEQ